MRNKPTTRKASNDNGPRLRIEYWPLTRLIPYVRNARTHSEAQIAEIAGSIRAFGFTNPILVGEEGDIVAGHGRLLAARQVGLAHAPLIVLRGLSETQRRQLVLADNRIALNAGWDPEMLTLELRDLAALGVDLSALGFAKGELDKALQAQAMTGLTDEDAVPETTGSAVARLGDVWALGGHRLACGDSTNADAVRALLRDLQPTLMVTDPPYGVSYDPTWRHRAGVNKSPRRGKVLNDDRPNWGAAWSLFPGDVAYVWHGALHAASVAESLQSQGFSIRTQIIWAKERLVIGRGDYHWQHEPCWYAVRNKGHWSGDRKQTTLWSIPSREQDQKTIHGTQKPVECMRRPMVNNSNPGQLVYDPFLGSGTTLIAAETVGRLCLGMELDPLYVDVAIRRWQAFTSQAAILDGDGRRYDDVAAQRLPSSEGSTASSVRTGKNQRGAPRRNPSVDRAQAKKI